jgi:hypothetical protein
MQEPGLTSPRSRFDLDCCNGRVLIIGYFAALPNVAKDRAGVENDLVEVSLPIGSRTGCPGVVPGESVGDGP